MAKQPPIVGLGPFDRLPLEVLEAVISVLDLATVHRLKAMNGLAYQLPAGDLSELIANPLAKKVTMQTAGRNLTLTGSLTLAEHRELLSHLRSVPSGVHVIDDLEYAEDANPPAAPAGGATGSSTSVGWIWVRSDPLGARILVDGAETGLRTPARLELQPGQHEIQLARRGFTTVHRSITVDGGHTIQFMESLFAQ